MPIQRKKPSAEKRSAFSAREVAERWGKSRQFIYNLINDGKLRSFKAGTSRLIPASEIERVESGRSS